MGTHAAICDMQGWAIAVGNFRSSQTVGAVDTAQVGTDIEGPENHPDRELGSVSRHLSCVTCIRLLSFVVSVKLGCLSGSFRLSSHCHNT